MKFKIFKNGVYHGTKTLNEFAKLVQSIYGYEFVAQLENNGFTLVRA